MVKIITVYGSMLTGAMGRTLLLALLGLFFACIIGLFFGLLSVVRNKVCNIISQVFVDAVRGVPMIVLAFFIYFGIPYLFNTIIGGFNVTLTALQAGSACLALNCGAYMSEIIRAGIQSVDIGQMEAARSLGMSRGMAMRLIIIPQDQFFSAHVTDAFFFRRNMLDMIGCSALRTRPSSGHPVYDVFVGNIHIYGIINRLAGFC